jgi:hypothetical protein
MQRPSFVPRALRAGLALAFGCTQAPLPPLTVPTAVPKAPVTALEARFSGTYLYAGGDAERRAVALAVEKAVATMGFLVKSLARDSLSQRAEVRASYAFAFDGFGNLEVKSPGFPAELGPLDGTPFALETRDGDRVQLSQRFVEDFLVLEATAEEGRGRTEFRLSKDGATLHVHRVLAGPLLSAPVDFILTYQRQ